MVDALHEVHRILRPRGVLVDARPDSRVLAVAERDTARGYRKIGFIRTSRLELPNDRASDRAVASVARERLFKRGKRGRFWHRVTFDDLDGLRAYLANHLRFEHRVRWTISAAERRRIRAEGCAIRRAVRFEFLTRRDP